MGKNTQANVTYSNEVFKQYVLKLSTDLVWKNQALANASESSDVYDRYRSEIFLLANQGRLNFDVVRSFPRVVLRNVFGTSETVIDMYASDKNTIPENDRSVIVDEYQAALRSKNPDTGNYAYWDSIGNQWVEIYQETNNYYRMLMGIPDIGDTMAITLTDAELQKYYNGYAALTTAEKAAILATPIQNLPNGVKLALETDGVLSELRAVNPTKKYLEFIGQKKIDYYISRSAEKFAILWRNSSDSETLNDAWDQNYEASRRMMTSVYYSNSFRRENELYDNFLAMAILFVTIHQMQNVYLRSDFTRDFYDLESLKIIYDSYDVPFYPEVPIKYHQRVVKNINRLIASKGSDNVFFDLFDIFDMGTMELYNYFFVKRHLVDDSRNPIFRIKYDPMNPGGFIIDDDDARIQLSDDDEVATYDWFETGIPLFDANGRVIVDQDSFDWIFSKVPVGADPSMVVTDSSTYVPYSDITEPDPYWVEDEYLQDAKGRTNVNFIESKYLSLDTFIDMMRIVYESTYLFRSILDNHIDTTLITTLWTDVGIQVSMFDMIIYTCMVISRVSGYEDDLSGRIPAVVETLGFDYENITAIIAQAGRNQYTSRNNPINSRIYELLDSLTTSSFTEHHLSSFEDIDREYNNITELRGLIADRFINASSIEEFEAYRQLYRSIMISLDITSTYMNPDDVPAMIIDNEGNTRKLPLESGEDESPSGIGIRVEDEIFRSFNEVLEFYNPELFQHYLLIEDSDAAMEAELVMAINKLKDMLAVIQYMPIAFSDRVSNSTSVDTLVRILDFFKSAKAELFDYNITFVVRDRENNLFRQMDRVMRSANFQMIVENDVRNYMDYVQTDSNIIRFADINRQSDLNLIDVLFEQRAENG